MEKNRAKGDREEELWAWGAEELAVVWDTDPIPETMEREKVGRLGYGTKGGASRSQQR